MSVFAPVVWVGAVPLAQLTEPGHVTVQVAGLYTAILTSCPLKLLVMAIVIFWVRDMANELERLQSIVVVAPTVGDTVARLTSEVKANVPVASGRAIVLFAVGVPVSVI
jgi:hypothetical protein